MVIISNSQRDQVVKYLCLLCDTLQGDDTRTYNKKRLARILMRNLQKRPVVSAGKLTITMEKEQIDLGWANGWMKTPAVLKDAMAKKYPVVETFSNHRGETRYQCETDKAVLTWKVDSSD